MRRRGILTAVGIIGLIPAVVLVASGLSGKAVPALLVHPAFVFGGLGAALCASFVAVTHWDLTNERGSFRISCTIRRRPTDVAIFVVSLLLLVVVVGYLFNENFKAR